MAPFRATIAEVVQRWGTTVPRRDILIGLLELREALRSLGVINGFQWLNGSFTEQCEALRGRAPNDIDVITFLDPPPHPPPPLPVLTILQDHDQTKTRYKVDHIMINLRTPAVGIVDQTRFWFGLFTHRRSDDVWKGIVQISLNTPVEDAIEMQQLRPVASP
jgi:uncharacterized protein DUF6932